MPEVIVDRPKLVVDAVAGCWIDRRYERVRFAALIEIEMAVIANVGGDIEGCLVRVFSVRGGLEDHPAGDGEVPLLVDFSCERLVAAPHFRIRATVHRQR